MTDQKLRPPTLEERVDQLEQTVDALERALHLALVGVQPTLTWLDAKLGREWPRNPPARTTPLPDPVVPTR